MNRDKARPDGLQSATVAIVIPCFGQARFLAAAIESALDQIPCPDQVIVVDDGGDEDLLPITRRLPQVRLVRQANQGLAAARNSGLRAATSTRIIFLDADDRLLPGAIAAGLRGFDASPEAAFVYGAYREVGGGPDVERFHRVDSHAELVQFNWVGMIAAVMFDRATLLQHGGFDESLRRCEDWDAYLRLSREHPFNCHDALVACYVRHAGNMSNDAKEMRRWVEVVRAREWQRGLNAQEQAAWREGEMLWAACYPDRSFRGLAQRVARATFKRWRALRRSADTPRRNDRDRPG